MHSEALGFATRAIAGMAVTGQHVLEIGSRNLNGSVRPLFADCASYTGIDLLKGPGVDVVADGATFVPLEPPDLVISCETLEHTDQASAIVRNAAAILSPGGYLIVTCATTPRTAHSGIDGGPLKNGEFYANVVPDDLQRWLKDAGLVTVHKEVHTDRGDLYALAWKAA